MERWQLKQMQSLPLDVKVEKTCSAGLYKGKVYVDLWVLV